MNRPELYQKTVDILVKAYFDDTLIHGDCYACAVGNIIAGNCGFTYGENEYSVMHCDALKKKGLSWNEWLNYPNFFIRDSQNMSAEERDMVARTGYSFQELCSIESAFEDEVDTKGDEMFNGLMAVVEALDKIHENTNEETTKQSKQKFNKQLA